MSQVEGVLGNTAQNASQGVSPSVNAVDTGIQAAMALSGLMTSGLEAAFIPALQALGLSGMACLPISKQLDPVLGIDCHIMIPGGPLPNPYIGLLINPKDFLAVAVASILPPPPAMPEEGEAQEGEGDTAKLLNLAHMGATMVIGMLGATVKIGNFIPRAVAGTPTRNIWHLPFGGTFVLPPMNKGHAFMGSLNVLVDDDPLSGGGAHLHMDCWDIGIPTPHLVKKSVEYAALFLPTGVIIPIPWHKPILTNSIPIPINPITAVKKLLMGSFARFYKKKTKRIATKLHNKINQKIKTATLAEGGGGVPPKNRGNKPLKGLDPIKPQPPFKKNKKHNAKEFRKPLDMQEDGLNKMSVKEYLDNRDAYRNMNVAQKKNHNNASKKARDKFRAKKEKELSQSIRRSAQKKGKPISKQEAKRQAQNYLSRKDALHEVDAIAGGNNKVVRMGDRGVNRSLGSQWNKKGIADNIELQVRVQIR